MSINYCVLVNFIPPSAKIVLEQQLKTSTNVVQVNKQLYGIIGEADQIYLFSTRKMFQIRISLGVL